MEEGKSRVFSKSKKNAFPPVKERAGLGHSKSHSMPNSQYWFKIIGNFAERVKCVNLRELSQESFVPQRFLVSRIQ